MYKQLVSLAKNKDGEDSDEEAYQENERRKEEAARIKRERELNRPRTPILVDSDSDLDMGKNAEKSFQQQIIEETYSETLQNEANEEQEGASPGGPTGKPGDEEFVKYVWNKKTKRLERRDMRLTTNFDKIDKKKFENFIKVNQKSKVLNM